MGRKRRHYRVAPESLFLSATLHLASGKTLEGYVLDVSGGGAGMLLGDAELSASDRSGAVDVVLDSYRLAKPIRLRGRIRGWVRLGDAVRCGLEFEDDTELHLQIPPELRQEFNRRRHPRWTAEEPIRVQVTRSTGMDYLLGRMVDLSVGGAKVVMGLAEARKVEEWQRVYLAFLLPDDPLLLRVAATVRSRYGIRLGLEFDEVRTREFGEFQERVRRFVEAQEEGEPARPDDQGRG